MGGGAAAHATKHGAGLEVEMPSVEEARQLRIGVVRTRWHPELIDKMADKFCAKCEQAGVQRKNILHVSVPGSFELPYAAERLVKSCDVDVVICIGVLLKGGTIHMEVIANAVTAEMMALQIELAFL